MSRDEIKQWIQQLNSDDITQRQTARDALVKQGDDAIYPLIYAFDSDIEINEIINILEQLPRDMVIGDLNLVVRYPNDFSPNIVKHAKDTLILFDEEPIKAVHEIPCHEINLTIDDKWTTVKLSLLHPESSARCHWEAAIIYLLADDDKETYSYRPTDKADTDALMRQLSGKGFKQLRRSVDFRWEYYTFEKAK